MNYSQMKRKRSFLMIQLSFYFKGKKYQIKLEVKNRKEIKINTGSGEIDWRQTNLKNLKSASLQRLIKLLNAWQD